ncbi:MAG: hypothetical protein ABWY19_11835 [Marmoricola sp.]
MFTHDSVHRSLRRRLRPVILLAGAAWLALGVMVGPASADTPEAWETPPEASPFGYVLILLIIPLGAAAVIALLAVLPQIMGDKGYEPGQSWRGDTEWFGGPTKGVKAADDVTPDQIEQSSQGAGGTSGRW